MRRFIPAALVLLTAFPALPQASGLITEQLAGGLQFQRPRDWAIQSQPQGALLLPPGVVPKPEPEELYLVHVVAGAKAITDADLSARIVSQMGNTATFTPRRDRTPIAGGFRESYSILGSKGEQGEMTIYAIGLSGGGVATLTAMGLPNRMRPRESALRAITESIRVLKIDSAPSATDAISKLWDQRLRGATLRKFSGYNSNTSGGGGTSSDTTLRLLANGRFEFAHSSVVSMPGLISGGAKQDSDRGTWRIYSQAATTYLEMSSPSTGQTAVTLSEGNNRILLNNDPWLLQR
jgi:hypothetical protein